MTSHFKNTIIVNLSEVVQDKHGLFHVDLELADGTVGYYPSNEEFLKSLYVGAEVMYIDTKHFNKRNKINGLNLIKMAENNNKVYAIVKAVTNVEKNKGFYFRTLVRRRLWLILVIQLCFVSSWFMLRVAGYRLAASMTLPAD